MTNAVGHLRELDDLVADIAGTRPLRAMLAFTMEDGAEVLQSAFADRSGAQPRRTPRRHRCRLPSSPYIASTKGLYRLLDTDRLGAAISDVVGRVAAGIERDGVFTISTATGCFVCR